MGAILFNPHMPMDRAAIFLALLVAFNVTFEYLTEKLEEKIEEGEDNEHLIEIIATIYRELMILGFISFTLVMLQQFASIPAEYLLPFEFGHLLIFGAPRVAQKRTRPVLEFN